MTGTLHCVYLFLFMSLVLCASYDSQESRESFENVFINPYRAHAFMRNRGLYGNYYRVKSAAERQSEVCEDFPPCRISALRFGPAVAYQVYFGDRRFGQNLRRF